jgi:hypothetical protein
VFYEELFDEGGWLESGFCRFFARIIAFYEELFDEGGWLESGFWRFCARIIAFYEELFDEGGSHEGGFCRGSRAKSRFRQSRLARAGRLKAVSVVFRMHAQVLG